MGFCILPMFGAKADADIAFASESDMSENLDSVDDHPFNLLPTKNGDSMNGSPFLFRVSEFVPPVIDSAPLMIG